MSEPCVDTVVFDVKRSSQSKKGDIITSVSSLLVGESTAKGATFYMKETSQFIESIGKKPKIEIRFGATHIGSVIPIIVMIKIKTSIYRGWIDYHAVKGEGERIVSAIENDNHLIFCFVGDSNSKENVFTIRSDSALKLQFKEIVSTMKRASSWQYFNFEAIKSKLEVELNCNQILWGQLGK